MVLLRTFDRSHHRLGIGLDIPGVVYPAVHGDDDIIHAIGMKLMCYIDIVEENPLLTIVNKYQGDDVGPG